MERNTLGTVLWLWSQGSLLLQRVDAPAYGARLSLSFKRLMEELARQWEVTWENVLNHPFDRAVEGEAALGYLNEMKKVCLALQQEWRTHR